MEWEDYELEEALKHAREKVEAKRRMRERRKKQNEAFVWTPKNVAKIIRLNDKLWDLMQEADRIGKSIYSDFQKMNAEEDPLWDSVETWYGRNGYDLMNECGEKPLNWNIIEFNRPEFEQHYFCYLMHWFFHEGLYSLQDAVAMDPEEFHIYTRIFN
jgi:hypothetical protein